MIKPIAYDSGRTQKITLGESKTVVKYDLLVASSGLYGRATSGATEVRFMALQDQVTGAGETTTTILALYLDGILCEADTTNNTAAALVGTYIDLTDHDHLNDAASDTDVFYVTEIIGAAADKKVRGYFVMKAA